MMVHLFLTDDTHVMLNAVKPIPPNGMPEEDITVLYEYGNGAVGYYPQPQTYLYLPAHRIKEVRITRKPGEAWPG